jgi:hypothetical protein
MSDSTELAVAAVAVVDALGFKGIWRNHSPHKVLGTLKALKRSAVDISTWGNSFVHQDVHVTTALFSDTVVTTAVAAAGSAASERDLVRHVVRDVLKLTTTGLTTDPPMAYRGCIAFGQVMAENGFFVGPAIDEAAESADSADAAIVWLCPSAKDKLGALVPGETEDIDLLAWQVPMKPTGTLATHAVNVMAWGIYPGCVESAAWDRPDVLRRGALARFHESKDPRVAVKRLNTEAFLDAAEAHSRSWWLRHGMKP